MGEIFTKYNCALLPLAHCTATLNNKTLETISTKPPQSGEDGEDLQLRKKKLEVWTQSSPTADDDKKLCMGTQQIFLFIVLEAPLFHKGASMMSKCLYKCFYIYI